MYNNNSIAFDFDEIFKEASQLTKAVTKVTCSHPGSPALTIQSNGTGRITLNRILADTLQVDETIQIILLPINRQILIGTRLPFSAAVEYPLNDGPSGTKLFYCTALVKQLTIDMNLKNYFKKKNSLRLSQIHFQEIDGVPAAAVQVDDMASSSSGTAEKSDENESENKEGVAS